MSVRFLSVAAFERRFPHIRPYCGPDDLGQAVGCIHCGRDFVGRQAMVAAETPHHRREVVATFEPGCGCPGAEARYVLHT